MKGKPHSVIRGAMCGDEAQRVASAEDLSPFSPTFWPHVFEIRILHEFLPTPAADTHFGPRFGMDVAGI
jgi:hypothetical protein